MSQKIRVDFFHDAICGWCYVLSPRLRRLATEFDLDVHLHAFALSPTRADQIRKFGSVKQAKQIILGHWERLSSVACARCSGMYSISPYSTVKDSNAVIARFNQLG